MAAVGVPRFTGCAAHFLPVSHCLMTAATPVNPAINRRALCALATAHGCNDLFQALLPALYPVLHLNHGLSYSQLGLLGLAFHLTGCIGQPAVGAWADRRPKPWLLPCTMLFMAAAMALIGVSGGFAGWLAVAVLLGLGSSILHPEGSRAARAAAPAQPGKAQALFQVGGNLGSALAPLLLATLLARPLPQVAAWMTGLALVAGAMLLAVQQGGHAARPLPITARPGLRYRLGSRQRRQALGLLALLLMSKYVYLACMANFYSLFLIQRFDTSLATAQWALGGFLLAIALGSLLGGVLADRLGHRRLIAASILGACPFSVCLPWAPLWVGAGLALLVGVIMASAFAAILVMAQALLPGREGLVAGGFFGLTFGISGAAAAVLGMLADLYGLGPVFTVSGWLPLLGITALWLPKGERAERPG